MTKGIDDIEAVCLISEFK